MDALLAALIDAPPGIALTTLCWMLIGLVVGSFLNVVVYRLPLGQSVVHGGSHCPRCSAA